MTPTIGRIVLFRDKHLASENNGESEAPAVIVRVWSDTCVNLKVLLDGPVEKWVTSVVYSEDMQTSYAWRWPPRV